MIPFIAMRIKAPMYKLENFSGDRWTRIFSSMIFPLKNIILHQMYLLNCCVFCYTDLWAQK